MATALDLITEAYDLLNHPGQGQSLPASDASNALNIMNRMLESLTLRRAIPYYIQREDFDLVSGTSSYTIGSGGDFNTTRPNRILEATIKSGNNEYPMFKLDYQQWMSIYNKSDTNDVPRAFYYEANFPLGKIYLYGVPSDSSADISIASEKIFGSYALSDSISLPPGYEKMVIYNLARELLPKFPVEAQAPFIIQEARQSLKDIARVNIGNMMTEMDIDYGFMTDQNADRRYFWS